MIADDMPRTRVATAADRAAVVALWGAAGLVRGWNPPEADFDQALANPSSTVLILQIGEDPSPRGTVMVGFDGHRGWVYYLATDPAHRGAGHGKALMRAAEDWLRAKGCRKLELIVRGDNTPVRGFYFAQGYTVEDRALLAKWLVQPPEHPPDLFDKPLPATITWLEMTERPAGPARPAPTSDLPFAILRLHAPPLDYYRYLQKTVGEPWLWWMRRALDDAALAARIHHPAVEIHQLLLGGAPAGFVEFDFRDAPEVADLAYFGLMPWATGRGLGGWFLDWSVRAMWAHASAPRKLTVNTCNHDHAGALALYQKIGFRPIHRTEELWPDPRGRGLVASRFGPRPGGDDQG